jgi:hypothetical protein
LTPAPDVPRIARVRSAWARHEEEHRASRLVTRALEHGAVRMTARGDARERDAHERAERGDFVWPALAPRPSGPAGEVLAELGPGSALAGHDDVRIHSGDRATSAARALGTRAFTIGARDIVLAHPDLRSDTALVRHELAHLAQATRDEVPVIARDDDVRRYYTPGASDNADEVIAAAYEPSSIAGRGNYHKVQELLRDLPTPMLLETVLELGARGELHELWSNGMSGRPGRERAAIASALLMADAPAWGELEAPMVFGELAQDLEWLDDADRAAFVECFGGDEMMAIVESIVDFGVVAPNALIMGANVIGPGPVNRPGQMPWPYYIGLSAHDAIASYYEAAHPEHRSLIYTNRIANRTIIADMGLDPGATRMRKWKLDAEPDIVNMGPIPGHLYEIKPWSAAPAAMAEAMAYTSILRYAGVNVGLGPSSDPGVQGVIPAPGGYVVFWSPAPGVILYQWGPGTFDPKRFVPKAFPWQLVVLFAGAVAIAAIVAAPETGGASIWAPILAL